MKNKSTKVKLKIRLNKTEVLCKKRVLIFTTACKKKALNYITLSTKEYFRWVLKINFTLKACNYYTTGSLMPCPQIILII